MEKKRPKGAVKHGPDVAIVSKTGTALSPGVSLPRGRSDTAGTGNAKRPGSTLQLSVYANVEFS